MHHNHHLHSSYERLSNDYNIYVWYALAFSIGFGFSFSFFFRCAICAVICMLFTSNHMMIPGVSFSLKINGTRTRFTQRFVWEVLKSLHVTSFLTMMRSVKYIYSILALSIYPRCFFCEKDKDEEITNRRACECEIWTAYSTRIKKISCK